MTQHLGPVILGRQVAERELFSARPDAPVVISVDRAPRPKLRRTRLVTAAALHRAAAKVAPAC